MSSTSTACACCSATAGDSSAPRTRSPSSSPASRRSRRLRWPRSAPRWKDGCAARACPSDVTRRRAVIGTLAATALVLLLGRWASQQYTDALWYESLGARDVWNARFVNGMILRIGSFLAASAFTFVNLYAVRQSVVSLVLPRRI